MLDIGLHRDYIKKLPCQYRVIERTQVRALLPVRNVFSHKGTYGHGLVVGGSYGMMGAAILAAQGVLRSGAGLVTMYLPNEGITAAQSAFPEAIVRSGKGEMYLEDICGTESYSAVAVGTGMGREEESREVLHQLFKHSRKPLVLDADALYHLSAEQDLMKELPPGSILTPHPGEFDRLFGTSASTYERHLKQLKMAGKYRCIIVLKGAYTGIATPGGEYWFNTSGNNGMATGGSGDVLTGIILALLAQGLSATDAAISGVYLHGLAGDIAAGKVGETALIAGDIASAIGEAFMQVKARPYLQEGRRGGVIQ